MNMQMSELMMFFFYVFIDFHGLQYSVQQISYKSGQSIINDQQQKKIEKIKIKAATYKIRLRPGHRETAKIWGKGSRGCPKSTADNPTKQPTGRKADQPVPLSPQYKTDSIIVRWRKFDTLM